jgi:hypothetical protein
MYLIDTNHCSLAILGNVNILSRFAEVENSPEFSRYLENLSPSRLRTTHKSLRVAS